MAINLITLTAEAGAESGGPNPYLIGVIVLALLLAVLGVVMTIGGGREHS